MKIFKFEKLRKEYLVLSLKALIAARAKLISFGKNSRFSKNAFKLNTHY